MTIPGFSAYDITEDGVVTYLETGMIMQPRKTCSSKYYDYMRVYLIGDDGRQHACNMLRLLALAFLDKPDVPCMARAKDGDNTNAVLSNVEWVPYSYTAQLNWRNGKYDNRKPKKNTCCSEESMALVLNTLEQLDKPITVAEISRLLEVPYSTARYTITALLKHGKIKNIYKRGYVLACQKLD